MSMNTPIGNITQTTPIKNFKELNEMQNEQYLLGIDNNTVGNGSKISLENLINSSISADSDNLITKGTDDRLLVNTPVEIGDLSDLTTTNKSTLVAAINEVDDDITTEATTRQNTDNNLQSQIDAITSASDVTDIVGTYAELQAYDTTGLADKSVIKVLQDESRQDETTYYRWVITDDVGAWVLIGEEGPYYTISQADSKFATQATVGNLNNLATSDKSSVVNAMNELASVLDPTQTADYIKNSKGLKSGEVSTNSIILNNIKDYAHSTFDKSKFTVAGSPVITDDGIASGFSNNPKNAITCSYLIGSLTEDFEFEIPIVVTQELLTNYTTENYICNSTPNNQFRASYYPQYGSFAIWLKLSDESMLNFGLSLVNEIKYSNLSVGDIVSFVFGRNVSSGKYYIKAKLNDVVKGSQENTQSLNPYVLDTAQYLGTWSYAGSTDIKHIYGAIDLKRVKATVDGVPVFSGNKTGIDTIKPSNFTAITSGQDSPFENPSLPFSDSGLTISADGVASGFSSSNYVDINPISLANKKWRIDIPIQITSGAHSAQYIFSTVNTSSNNYGLLLNINSNNELSLFLSSNGTSWDVVSGWGCGILSTDKDYIIAAEYDLTNYYVHKISEDGQITITIDRSAQVYENTTTSTWRIGNWSSYGSATNIIVDLNAFKIYVDGNLVYQPCLKIPYTWSSTGSKIADATYRNRVTDAYEQGFSYRYYTLDVENGNFTLPMGEVYGDIENALNVNTATQAEKDTVNGWGIPDYANGISISEFPYTAPADGYIDISLFNCPGDADLYINNILVGHSNYPQANAYGYMTGQFKVEKGDVISVSAGGIQFKTFFPLKGGN